MLPPPPAHSSNSRPTSAVDANTVLDLIAERVLDRRLKGRAVKVPERFGTDHAHTTAATMSARNATPIKRGITIGWQAETACDRREETSGQERQGGRHRTSTDLPPRNGNRNAAQRCRFISEQQ